VKITIQYSPKILPKSFSEAEAKLSKSKWMRVQNQTRIMQQNNDNITRMLMLMSTAITIYIALEK